MKSQKNIQKNMVSSINSLKKELDYFNKIEYKNKLTEILCFKKSSEKNQKIKI